MWEGWVIVALGTWPFWFFLGLFIIWEIWELESRYSAGEATGSLVVFLALLWMFTDFRKYLHGTSIGDLIIYVACYGVIGAAYMFLRYWIYLNDKMKAFRVNELNSIMATWNDEGARARRWGSQYKTPKEMLRGQYYMPPYPIDRGVRNKMYMWMVYWPLSGLWVAIHRPFEWLFDLVYMKFGALLKSMSDYAFKKYFPELH